MDTFPQPAISSPALSFTQVLRAEWSRIATRRAAHGLAAPQVTPCDDPSAAGCPGLGDTIGLALSGGGVRSATFSLGLMQALARARALESFDYLSTVSGGGYAGAFFGSLFARGPAAAARPEDDALDRRRRASLPYDVLRGPVHRPETVGPTERPAGWQLWWLRNSGRYLAPTGAGDYLYAVALALRNLLAIHYVVGVAALLLGVVAIVADEALAALFLQSPVDLPGAGYRGAGFGLLAALWLAVGLAPLGLAYFVTEAPRPGARSVHGTFWWIGETFWNTAGAALAAIGVAICLLPATTRWWGRWAHGVPTVERWLATLDLQFAGSTLVAGIVGYVGLVATLALACLARAARGVDSGRAIANLGITAMHDEPVAGKMLSTRVVLTKQLAAALKFEVMLVVAGGLVAASYELIQRLEGLSFVTLTTGGAGALLIVLVKKAAGFLGSDAARLKFAKLPLNTLALLLGSALLTGVLVLWFTLVWVLAASLLDRPLIYLEAVAAPLVGVFVALLPLAWIAGDSFQFVNLSSIQNLYASRLVRAYLGASNPARATDRDMRWARISDTHPADDLSLDRYYAAGSLAPVHLINVTLNETVSPTDPLVQRDRHGRPLAISPDHFCVDGEWTLRPPDATAVPARSPLGRLAVRLRHWLRRMVASTRASSQPDASPAAEVPESLSLGAWISISGAAFSTGIGRGTTLGKSLLLGLSNVRLGYWWSAGALARTPRKNGLDRLLQWVAGKFQTQSYLAGELLGRFSGRYARYWYLSDGGHFDNTGVYELLRRGVGLVVCSDNGADPGYTGADVANLMRIARIDFGCEFDEIGPAALRARGGVAARLEPLVMPAGACDRGRFEDGRCLRLFWVTRPPLPGRRGRPNGTVLVVVKPRLVEGAPGDLAEYASTSADFPQESTADQFFVEAQWESYRKLGQSIGEAVARALAFDARAGAADGAARWRRLRRELCLAAHRVDGTPAHGLAGVSARADVGDAHPSKVRLMTERV